MGKSKLGIGEVVSPSCAEVVFLETWRAEWQYLSSRSYVYRKYGGHTTRESVGKLKEPRRSVRRRRLVILLVDLDDAHQHSYNQRDQEHQNSAEHASEDAKLHLSLLPRLSNGAKLSGTVTISRHPSRHRLQVGARPAPFSLSWLRVGYVSCRRCGSLLWGAGVVTLRSRGMRSILLVLLSAEKGTL